MARAFEGTLGRDIAYDLVAAFLQFGADSSEQDEAIQEVLLQIPTRGQLRAQYYAGVTLIGTGAASIAAGSVMLRRGDLRGFGLIAAGFAMVQQGGEQIIAARQDDLKYYGGSVLESLDPVTRAFIQFFFCWVTK